MNCAGQGHFKGCTNNPKCGHAFCEPCEKESDRQKAEGGKCITCERQQPIVFPTGLCGPCCFGEAATDNGNW